ncbi:MAG: siderophore-interacting protein [Nocardioides sp.]
MSTRAAEYPARVRAREQLTSHLVRLTLDLESPFPSTGVPDEWVGLVIAGQFQSRYYTVRSATATTVTLDVVIHHAGLVTEWASRDCAGEPVTITAPRSSFSPPADASWLYLVGDLTAAPAMARIAESAEIAENAGSAVRIWAEVPGDLDDYFPASAEVTWLSSPADGSRLAEVVQSIEWPDRPGYFWMAGESTQMRLIRKYLMRERRGTAYDVMGYWRRAGGRQPRAVDPGPIWQAGKAAGQSDEEIWAAYDAVRDETAPGVSGK